MTGCPHVPIINPKPPPKPPRGPVDPPVPRVPPTSDDILREEAESDEAAHEIICFAYVNFYDSSTGVSLPTQEEFAEYVVEQLAPAGSQAYYRQKATSLYEHLQEGDLEAVAQDLAC
jgi:hypothetical protein